MKKAAIPALIVIIFLAFGIILAAVVIYWAINMFTQFVQGKCWADMGKTADSIVDDLKKAGTDTGSTETKKITMGDCAGGMIIFNKKEVFDDNGNVISNGLASGFSQVIQDTCTNSKSAKSFILVIPFKSLAEEARQNTGFFSRLSEWLTHPVLSFKQVWEEGRQYIVRIKPICKSLDIEIDNSVGQPRYYCIPNGVCDPSDLSNLKIDILNKGTISYCYKPVRFGSSPPYAYRLEGLAECTK
ncbi:MAG: hypothetical protein NTY20_05505 [Candidatus Aenigmarchaeota archaeon]|nr:hypothetical protein [Candidatus Aenigmarchaeota archaeon]